MALDLLFGFAGLLSFGQAMFWGGSAYVAAILVQNLHLDGALALGAGALYAALLAALVGTLVVRRSGIYFAMITLAIAQIEYFVAVQLKDLTGGENGLPMDTRGTFFGMNVSNDTRVLFPRARHRRAVRLVRHPHRWTRRSARCSRAIRQNETRAIALGYRVNRFKLATFIDRGSSLRARGRRSTLSAIGWPGLEMIDWHTSGAVVMMAILGGSGTIVGPIIGAAHLSSASNTSFQKRRSAKRPISCMGLVFAILHTRVPARHRRGSALDTMAQDFDLELLRGRLRARRFGKPLTAYAALCIPGLSSNSRASKRLGERFERERPQC